MNNGVTICPHCLRNIQVDGKCPCCERHVESSEWEIPLSEGRSFNPCDPHGLEPPYEENSPYRGRVLNNTLKGNLRSYSYYDTKSGLGIIGNGVEADISIHGVPELSGVHAILAKREKKNGFECGWWLFDCGNDEIGTYVNGKRVIRSRLLREGDRIEIAGVAWCFTVHPVDPCVARLAVAKKKFEKEEDAVVVEHMSVVVGKGKKLLDDISFTVRKGEFVGIVGPSGCGKSSLIQRLAGVAKFSGDVRIVEKKLDGAQPYGEIFKNVVYLPQNVDQSLHETLTIDQEISSYCRIFQIDLGAEEKDAILQKLYLKGKEKKRIGSLSGGEKRRVGIVLALLRDPQVLLLDEPCAGLDSSTSMELMEYCYKLSANEEKTILCVTHVLDDFHLFDRLIVLKEGGGLDYIGRPADLLKHYHCDRFYEVYERLKKESGDENPDVGFGARITTFVKNTEKKKAVKEWWSSKAKQMVEAVSRCFLSMTRPLTYVKWYLSQKRDVGIAGLGQVCFNGYFRRAFLEQSWATWLWYGVQPLLIVIGIRVACAFMFKENSDHIRIGTAGETLDFCVVLSVFWLSIINSARELVRERVPGRSLDRLGGVSLLPYVLSKYCWVFCISFIQCLLFTVFLKLSGQVKIDLVSEGVQPSVVTSLTVPWTVIWPLLTCSLMGAFCGLSISASTSKDIMAVMVVPNLAVLALLFNKTVMQFDTNGVEIWPWAVCFAKEYMPCHASASAVSYAFSSRGLTFHALFPPLKQLVFYFVVSFMCVWFCQRYREHEWQGRAE